MNDSLFIKMSIHHRLSRPRHDSGFEMDIMANGSSGSEHPISHGEYQLLGQSRVLPPQQANENNSHHT
jgi:hypothetical protein